MVEEEKDVPEIQIIRSTLSFRKDKDESRVNTSNGLNKKNKRKKKQRGQQNNKNNHEFDKASKMNSFMKKIILE